MRNKVSVACSGGDGVDDGEHTMVKVLCSQRDRFKDKVHQLEVQLAEVWVPGTHKLS